MIIKEENEVERVDEFGRLIGRKMAVLESKRRSKCVDGLKDREARRRKRLIHWCDKLGLKVLSDIGQYGDGEKHTENSRNTENNTKSDKTESTVKSSLKIEIKRAMKGHNAQMSNGDAGKGGDGGDGGKSGEMDEFWKEMEGVSGGEGEGSAGSVSCSAADAGVEIKVEKIVKIEMGEKLPKRVNFESLRAQKRALLIEIERVVIEVEREV